MNDLTTSEKITVWMKRNGHTQEHVANKMGITRQTFIVRMKANEFKQDEKAILATLGFKG